MTTKSRKSRPRPPLACALLAAFAACGALPEQPPALRDMEEPLDLYAEPDDEAARAALPAGSFSGLYLRDARETLAAKLDETAAVAVDRVVENSPAARAGLVPDDLLLEVAVGDGEPRALHRTSEWRQLELDTPPGTRVVLYVDRAGREARAELELVPRVRPAARDDAARYREEQRVGVVVRTATEFEARGAGLGPGGGAVIVGLSARSPWRAAGLRFGDLLAAVDDRPLAHPQDLLNALREPDRERIALTFVRDGERRTVDAPLSRREQELQSIDLPLLFSYEAERGRSEWSMLLGLLHYESTAAAWRFRLLWLIGFGGGDADRLLEQTP